jgi:hypothetical protein
MKIYVEIPEDVDGGWMKEKLKSRKQETAKDDNLIIVGFQHSLSAKDSRGPDHAVLLKWIHISSINQAAAEGVCLRDLLCDSVAPSLRGHDYALL